MQIYIAPGGLLVLFLLRVGFEIGSAVGLDEELIEAVGLCFNTELEADWDSESEKDSGPNLRKIRM